MSALLAETARPTVARTASASLEAACSSLATARSILEEPRSSLQRWRSLSELLVARKAFVNHSAACASESGPLVHLVAQKPRLTTRVARLDDDHSHIRRQFDRLIAGASRQDSIDIDSSELDLLGRSLGKHQSMSTSLAFEWANRDIGGEG
jgi:hypothetical protein